MARPAILPAVIILVLALPLFARSRHSPGDARGERLIDSLIQAMTIDEKVGQLVQVTGWWRDSLSGPSVSAEQQQLITRGGIS